MHESFTTSNALHRTKTKRSEANRRHGTKAGRYSRRNHQSISVGIPDGFISESYNNSYWNPQRILMEDLNEFRRILERLNVRNSLRILISTLNSWTRKTTKGTPKRPFSGPQPHLQKEGFSYTYHKPFWMTRHYSNLCDDDDILCHVSGDYYK